MHMSQRSSGDVACNVHGCRWREAVEVYGGLDVLEQERASRLDGHRRVRHRWLFVQFAPAVSGGATQECLLCGALVQDAARHREWHLTAEA
jgi:hypothetical protein